MPWWINKSKPQWEIAYNREDMKNERMDIQEKGNHLFITLPLISMIYIPRLINFALFFGVWRGLETFLTFTVAIVIYTIAFAILIWKVYKKQWKENAYPFVQSFITSVFCPCIIVYPESKCLFYCHKTQARRPSFHCWRSFSDF